MRPTVLELNRAVAPVATTCLLDLTIAHPEIEDDGFVTVHVFPAIEAADVATVH